MLAAKFVIYKMKRKIIYLFGLIVLKIIKTKILF